MAAQNGTGNTGGRSSSDRSRGTDGRSAGSGRGTSSRGTYGRSTGSQGSNSRSAGGSRGTGSRQGGSSGNRGKKRKNNSDLLTNVFLGLLLLTVVVLAILYFKKRSDEPADAAPTGQVQQGGVTRMPENITPEANLSPTPPEYVAPTGEVAGPEKDPDTAKPGEPSGEKETPGASLTPEPTSDTQAVTPEPTSEPEPTGTKEEEPTPSPETGSPAIDAEEANDILAGIFWEAGYRFTLADSDFSLDQEEYFRYDVSYSGQAQDYDVLVKKDDGDVYYFENGIAREFDGLPEHAQQPDDKDKTDSEMSAESAAVLLKEIPYTSLRLPAPLDECSLALDNWKTVVAGEESYCLNVFYNGVLAGNIYFTEEAKQVYYLDEFGEFVKVR